VAEVQGPNLNDRIVALRTALIILREISASFSKAVNYIHKKNNSRHIFLILCQAFPWANDLVKSIFNILRSSQKSSNHFDTVIEALRCLKVLLRLPNKFIEAKEKEKLLPVVSKYLKANSAFIAIEAAKVKMRSYYYY
jgi:hypothetical protein